MKTCNYCSQAKPLDQFHKNAASKDGLQVVCKPCNNARARKWNKQNYCPTKERDKLFARHGISREIYNTELAAQEGNCDICQDVSDLVIDHDHSCCDSQYSCGKCIRGLLCPDCNLALGIMRDSPSRLLSAVAYLGITPGWCISSASGLHPERGGAEPSLGTSLVLED